MVKITSLLLLSVGLVSGINLGRLEHLLEHEIEVVEELIGAVEDVMPTLTRV